jgi:hypothetical protein
MLDKDVCKNCWNKKGNSIFNWGWIDKDDDRWNKQNKVLCPFITERHLEEISIYQLPPKNCPYKLEHILKGENNENI